MIDADLSSFQPELRPLQQPGPGLQGQSQAAAQLGRGGGELPLK